MSDLTRYFEDVEVGDSFEIEETYEVTKKEVVEFAEQYDPQPFHVDEAAAEESMFGGLVASGWHTCAMAMRLLVDGFLDESGAKGAVGVDDLRWSVPIRPGDELSLRGEIVDKQPWSDEMGLVHSRAELYNQDEALVMSYVGLVLFERANG